MRWIAVCLIVWLFVGSGGAGNDFEEAQYTVIVLHPAEGFYYTSATAVSGENQVGYGLSYMHPQQSTGTSTAGGGEFRAMLWKGSNGPYVDLNPGQSRDCMVFGVSGPTQVGRAGGHAMLWHGTAASAVDLNPAGFDSSEASCAFREFQGGSGRIDQDHGDHALLWWATSKSAVDLNPPGYGASYVHGISGNAQVGGGSRDRLGSLLHALLWYGTPASAVDMNPVGCRLSVASGISGDSQVGFGTGPKTGSYDHAMLWHGTAKSVVDLHPVGFTESDACAVCGDIQVGNGVTEANKHHALLWKGTARSVLDLHTFLTNVRIAGEPLIESFALGVNANGDVVGHCEGEAHHWYALLWRRNRAWSSHH